jgi:hypothetical protein
MRSGVFTYLFALHRDASIHLVDIDDGRARARGHRGIPESDGSAPVHHMQRGGRHCRERRRTLHGNARRI